MSDHYRYDSEYTTRPPRLELIPLAEMVRRIEAVRMADILATGGQKRCSDCGELRSLRAYSIDRRNPDGRHHRCRACNKRYRLRLALRAGEGASS